MKKTLLYVLCSIAMVGTMLPAAAQQIDGDFSTWEDCHPWVKGSYINNAVGKQPSGWRSSNVNGVSGTGKCDKFVTCVDGHKAGVQAAQVQNAYVGMKLSFISLGAWAPGYLTLGTPWNTSKGTGEKDGGTFGGKNFKYRPDAISFFYKFNQDSKKTKASFVGYLWKGTQVQKNVPSETTAGREPNTSTLTDRDVCVLGKYDSKKHKGDTPTPSGDFALLASYEKYVESSVADWTEMVIPFEYKDAGQVPEKINVIFASADYFSTTGAGTDEGSVGDTRNVLSVDDVKLIYYHSLASCKYDGADVAFDSNNSAVVNAQYDEAKLSLVKKGVGATVEKSFDKNTGLLTINVKGNDYEADKSSITTYTIQFEKPAADPVVVSEKTYTEPLYVSINGVTAGPQDVAVLVQTRDDGKINFVLKNFILASEEGSMPVGNISVPGLEVKDGAFSAKETVTIEPGDLEGVDFWLGTELNEVPLDLKGRFVGDDHIKVSIDIDMSGTLGQVINVHLGYTPYVANMTVKEGRQYGTFYAPFAVTALPEGVKAYTCSALGQDGTTLVLDELTDGIKAGTPVIVENTSEDKAGVSQDFYNFDEDLKTEGGQYGLLHGVAESGKTLAPKGSYVLQTQDGGQKFYRVTDATGNLYVQANRCYLTLTSSESAVKSLAFPSGATAIDAVKGLLGGDAQIYDLEGRRLPALQKGINIVNGRKVMVK